MNTAVPLRIRSREHRGAVLVSLAGVLDVGTNAQLRDTLIKAATDQPTAVVVDVGELSVPSDYSLAVFTAVWIQLSEWPGVPLVVIATDPARRAWLAQSSVSRFVPVTSGVDAAMRVVGEPPTRRRSTLTLMPNAASSAVARDLVRRVCRQWGVASVVEDACAIVTELVENVVRHTASIPELRLELRRGLFSVAVADGDPRPAVLREAVNRAAPSAGLAIVAQLSRTWGCLPTLDGKVVWAVLRVS